MPLRFTRAGSPSVMLSGGAASPAVETSRPIGTFTHHEPYTQCVASDVRSFLQSFARGGCGLQAQSAESTGCHVERRAKPVVETSRRSGTFTLTVRTGSRLFHPRDPSTVLGVTDRNGYAWLGVTKKCTYFVVNREKCTTFGTSDPPERRGSRCR